MTTADTATEHYVPITEIAGDSISGEQYQRMVNRYHWALGYAADKDVLEIGCGSGQGLALLAQSAKRLTAGDYSAEVLAFARQAAPSKVTLQVFDACHMPFEDKSFNVLILFETIYYLESITAFAAEAARVLRPGGMLLITTPNKDLYDFNPSPHSVEYPGVVELEQRLAPHFQTQFLGDTPLSDTSFRQRVLRPVKAIAARLGLIPKTMSGKAIFKKLFFGDLRPMPAIIDPNSPPVAPTPLKGGRPDNGFKVLYCAALKAG